MTLKSKAIWLTFRERESLRVLSEDLLDHGRPGRDFLTEHDLKTLKSLLKKLESVE